MTSLNWLYVDINSYFATIEQQVNHLLRNKPIVVVPVLSDSTCAIAASYEAKLKGIKTGTKIYIAKKLCPDLICVLANHELYVKYHQKIFQEVNKYLCVDHIFSIDEAACRLTGQQRHEEVAVKLAKQIKFAIKKNVGEYINCSIGIASNRYLAKVATDMQKPNGLVVIRPSDIPDKLYSIKLMELPGIGQATYAKLVASGIMSVQQLYQLDMKHLRKIWGSIWGEKVWHLLRGADLPLEKPKNSTLSHSQVLAPELRDINNARGIALNLLLKAATRLRAKELYTSSIILSIETIDKRYLDSKIKIEPSSDTTTLAKALLNAWDDLVRTNKIVAAKKVCVSFPKLEAKSLQLSFSDLQNNKTNSKANYKKQLLSQSIDKLNAKYGSGTVSLGQITRKKSGVLIGAFGYIPEV